MYLRVWLSALSGLLLPVVFTLDEKVRVDHVDASRNLHTGTPNPDGQVVIIPELLHQAPPPDPQYHVDDYDEDEDDDSDIPLILDGHNDFAIWIRAFYYNRIYAANFTSTSRLTGQVDFPRLAAGGLGAQFWSVYVECPSDWADISSDNEVYYELVHDTLQQIDLVHRLIDAFPEYLQRAWSAADIVESQRRYLIDGKESYDGFDSPSSLGTRKPHRRIQSLLGVEGLHQIGNSASVLRMYHRLGVRYITLTHTCHNRYADSEEPASPWHGGLSEAGVDLVKEMNRVGLIVDLSHTSFATQRDVLRESRAPVIFSHSNAYTLCNHTRNVPDDILFELARKGGVIMVTFYPAFLRCDGQEASIEDVVDHIVYLSDLIGPQHVGIGADFDGMPVGPKGIQDVGHYKDLVALLKKKGFETDALAGILGLNAVRVLDQVEVIARQLQERELPLEDRVKPMFGV